MHRIGTSLLLPAFLLVCASSSGAQTVRGELVDPAGEAVVGTLVVLLDAKGGERARTLTDEAGHYHLKAPGAGTYRLRAERIGHTTSVSPPLELADGEVLEYRMVALSEAVQLEGLVVTGTKRRCKVHPRAGEETAVLWEEARKALDATAWGTAHRQYRFRTVRHERELDAWTLNVRKERLREESGYGDNPYASVPAEALSREGFVRNVDGFMVFRAPDAHVLLSDTFLDGHCFRVQPGTGEEAGLVGLAFEPLRRRDLTDIRGVLWVDARTAELRHLEYGYTGLKMDGPVDRVGGRVEFERLPTGAWIVRRWWIRMPILRAQHQGTGALVVGIREEGGEVREIRTAAGRVVRTVAGGALTGVAWDSTNAAPLNGAEVRLAGTEHRAATDSAGHFRLAPLPPGRYTAILLHPRLDSLGVPPPRAEVEIPMGGEARTELAAPSWEGILAALCPTTDPEERRRTAVVTGTVREWGSLAPGARVVLSWNRWAIAVGVRAIAAEEWQRIEVTTDPQGRYSLCGVPAGVDVRIAVASGEEKEWEWGRLRLDPQEVRSHDLEIAAPPRSEAKP